MRGNTIAGQLVLVGVVTRATVKFKVGRAGALVVVGMWTIATVTFKVDRAGALVVVVMSKNAAQAGD